MREAAKSLFATLRWAETVPTAEMVVMIDLSKQQDAHTAAVYDRYKCENFITTMTHG